MVLSLSCFRPIDFGSTHCAQPELERANKTGKTTTASCWRAQVSSQLFCLAEIRPEVITTKAISFLWAKILPKQQHLNWEGFVGLANNIMIIVIALRDRQLRIVCSDCQFRMRKVQRSTLGFLLLIRLAGVEIWRRQRVDLIFHISASFCC